MILARKDAPCFKVNLLRILGEVHTPEFDVVRVQRLIKQEMPLCYRLMLCVSSAAFGWRARISSVRQAMTLLGEEEMRRWLTLAALPALASDILMGMFSLLDAMVGRPIDELLGELHLVKDIRAVLLGTLAGWIPDPGPPVDSRL